MTRRVAKHLVKSGTHLADDLAASIRTSLPKVLESGSLAMETDMVDDIYGIPLHGMLSFQHLLGSDVFPFERVTELVGKKGSFKSTFGWFLFSLLHKYQQAPGIGFFFEGENKTNWRQIRGVYQDDSFMERLFVEKVDTIRDFCFAINSSAKQYYAKCPTASVPAGYFLDSMGMLANDDDVDAADKTGDASDAAGFASARSAQVITRNLKTWTAKYLRGKPAFLLYVNHVHEKMEQPGGFAGRQSAANKLTTPGGVVKDYKASTSIILSPESVQSPLGSSLAQVRLKTLKSALSDTGLNILLRIHTYNCVNKRYSETVNAEGVLVPTNAKDSLSSTETEDRVQRIYVHFDWNWSTGELVSRPGKDATWRAEDMNNILGLTRTGNKVSSTRLELKDVGLDVLGAAIHANPDVVRELQDVLAIQRYRAYVTVDANEPTPPIEAEPPQKKTRKKKDEASDEQPAEPAGDSSSACETALA